MKLADVEKRGAWLFSEWRLTYRVGWGQILKAAALIHHYMKEPEILTGFGGSEQKADANDEKGIMALEEAGYLTVRGVSEILKVPLMITFFNQLDLVRVTVACATDEFKEADYKAFNLSMCQFMDSAELAMY
ncbi:MAG: hypothetical protein IJM85_04795 [Clostridia bacterium]|nr:hypothetical protein [Clostridia bacterium]